MMRLAFAAILLLAVLSVVFEQPAPAEISVRAQLGSVVLLTWDGPKDARAWQVEARQLNGDWETVAMIWRGRALRAACPVGLTQFRVRAWRDNGPGAWSAPTRWLSVAGRRDEKRASCS